ncbi:acyl-CoA thioester hydrolase [Marinobacter sp. DSM 26671]|jgi:acyl-CoA thioester hydrolase|uniref:Acyl-CoA thioesterase n=1 Tax=Marinobacter adhaerens TaxID=1033846 RepID=A0A351PQH2_9GAMM|nr:MULTISPECIES: thioesterase family protein [unclassified Marinobacter]MCP4062891.1 acyl-CoA thioesterase [Gammaproteobacteria bacterium]MEC7728098.1 thioesterase family protein [Pseudomonadota bacterium]HAZ89792.1 acyl-CoA thioesterase [Marinobacter adhaerens]HBT34026.1 acyl-CoA thioesterase [Pusillimonas sp.]AKV94885.1 thioesterase [Marinobacter sp. CP1]|tara:strand:- start:79 stop:471 length:393 start_codon:yes stop_codon:yes gene_type:complete
MFHLELEPRFSDTDALGHISNTTLPVWFEQARTPVFRIFHPTLEAETWPLIIARLEIDLMAQSYWHIPVKIKTGIGKIGNSSFHVIQEAWQGDKQIARGVAVLIHFDYEIEKALPIPDDIKARLAEHAVA